MIRFFASVMIMARATSFNMFMFTFQNPLPFLRCVVGVMIISTALWSEYGQALMYVCVFSLYSVAMYHLSKRERWVKYLLFHVNVLCVRFFFLHMSSKLSVLAKSLSSLKPTVPLSGFPPCLSIVLVLLCS